jgi:hypothetical protein
MKSEITYKKRGWVEYEIDGLMFMALAKIEDVYSEEVLAQLDVYEPWLPLKNSEIQMVGGVVIHEKPFFFEIAYLKPETGLTVFLSVKGISCDEYLDYINLNKSLPQAKG